MPVTFRPALRPPPLRPGPSEARADPAVAGKRVAFGRDIDRVGQGYGVAGVKRFPNGRGAADGCVQDLGPCPAASDHVLSQHRRTCVRDTIITKRRRLPLPPPPPIASAARRFESIYLYRIYISNRYVYRIRTS